MTVAYECVITYACMHKALHALHVLACRGGGRLAYECATAYIHIHAHACTHMCVHAHNTIRCSIRDGLSEIKPWMPHLNLISPVALAR